MKVENKKVVTVYYELSLPSGEIADKADELSPFSFVHGGGNTISGFDSKLEGLSQGESFDFIIEPSEAYGEYDQGLLVKVPMSIFRVPDLPDDALTIGKTIPMQDPQGNTLYGVITGLEEEFVSMDFNHPLAGQSLHFKGKIASVRDASDSEIALGEPNLS
jgi:FKBP-type peptidyl-prolyl cis-trans isomerase SlyD